MLVASSACGGFTRILPVDLSLILDSTELDVLKPFIVGDFVILCLEVMVADFTDPISRFSLEAIANKSLANRLGGMVDTDEGVGASFTGESNWMLRSFFMEFNWLVEKVDLNPNGMLATQSAATGLCLWRRSPSSLVLVPSSCLCPSLHACDAERYRTRTVYTAVELYSIRVPVPVYGTV